MSGEYVLETDLHRYVGMDAKCINYMIEVGVFPAAIKPTPRSRAKVWLRKEVEAWQARRVAERLTYDIRIDSVSGIVVTVTQGWVVIGSDADRLKKSPQAR